MNRRHWIGFLLALLWLLASCRLASPVPSPTPTPLPTATATPDATPAPPPYELFIQPEDGRAPVLFAIAEARRVLRLAMYLITDQEIIQALKGAAARGVDVRVLLEMNPFGGGAQTAQVAAELKAAGVQVQWDPRTIRYLHQKTLVVDEAYALVMTANFTVSSFTANREYLIRTARPEDVAEIIATFEADWARQPVQHANPRLVWAPDRAREVLLQLIDSAQMSLDLEHQNLEDEEVIDHLIAAAQRGVRVRYLGSPHLPLEEDTDEPGRERIRQAGAEVRYLDSPYIHAKALIVDGRQALVGSINLTTNSLDFNRELSILVDEPYIVQALSQQFQADWDQARPQAVERVPTPTAGYVDHTQAEQYYGQRVTIQLTVTTIYRSPRVIWLMGDQNRDRNFKVVIFPEDWDKWPDRPDRYYKGKTIRVTGLVKKYRDWPEIIVDDPSQIEIVP
ncbi:MAG: phospholipase D-like domain-containing protein [Anaerolineae bacterium]|nr:phospholipase D-like domain-containing protein [Anaerolineae bacterium]MDW8100167.1 phospholipase D-like domain-containing protein [Anaerolineae bacterium]